MGNFDIIEVDSGEKFTIAGTDKAVANAQFSSELNKINVDKAKIDRSTDRGEKFNQLRRVVLEKVNNNYELRIVHGGQKLDLSPEEAILIIKS